MQEKPKAHILYVEDDLTLGFVTRENLEKQGYRVSHFPDGMAALKGYQDGTYDICVLDVMLPYLDGFTLAGKIRQHDQHIPILFLTAKSMIEDRIRGLSLGGDDYITKPYSMDELILKIEVFLRRSRIIPQEQPALRRQVIGNYILDADNLSLQGPGSSVTLTYKEAELLKYLNENRDKVLRRQDILIAVWGDDSYLLSRSLDVFISRLRKLLAEDPDIQIRSVHGVGFKFLVRHKGG